MPNFESILPDLIQMKVISIVGLEKNVGKTTTLNKIISLCKDRYSLGLTSIGLDGEKEDLVTNKPKPRIFIPKNTIIATAHDSIQRSDITVEILESTNFQTPYGEIIIVRAVSAGFVELAGPSQTSQIKYICDLLQKMNCKLVLVDGAISRKSLASPIVTQATILATGAEVSQNMEKTIDETVFTWELFNLPTFHDTELHKAFTEIKRVGYIDKNLQAHSFAVSTSLDAQRVIIDSFALAPQYLVIKGVITDSLIESLFSYPEDVEKIPFIIQDATKLFISYVNYKKFLLAGGKFLVSKPIKLLCITANPYSPSGYSYPTTKFLKKLRENILVPVFDVIGEE
jgi:molybdopterin-guanine dinucleotide biosynthesis protein